MTSNGNALPILHRQQKPRDDRATYQRQMHFRFLALTDYASQHCGERWG